VRCDAVPPQSAVIATFDAAGPRITAFGPFDGTSIAGGFYAYGCGMTAGGQAAGIALSATGGQLHVTGTVATYAGFGVFWTIPTAVDGGPFPGGITYAGGPLDVSTYAGIQFDISGDPGPLGLVTLFVTSDNQLMATPYVCGTCTGDAGACNTSTAPATGIGSMTKTVQIRWTDLTSSGASFDPSLLSNIAWGFAWTPGEAPYGVDVAIDNVEFMPGP
jgi:hypothetical protein